MVKLLDCTIRDGGHLNGWNFTEECVKASYSAAVKSGVDYFEIGYRFDNPKPEWGNFARCEDEFLMSLLEKNDKCKISIMIDAGKCSVDKFKECKPDNTIIDVVRVATYPDKLNTALNLCEKLKEKEYAVFLNLMDFSDFGQDEYDVLNNWKNKNILEAIYFADSFGSFYPDDVEKYYNYLKLFNYNNISFHSHNNLQMAFANTIKAIELGAYSVDASIFGMGRDAGNLPAELITGYLKNKYNSEPYIEIIEKFYLEHIEKTPWGYGIKSLIGGLKNIHPSRVDELFSKKNTIHEILER